MVGYYLELNIYMYKKKLSYYILLLTPNKIESHLELNKASKIIFRFRTATVMNQAKWVCDTYWKWYFISRHFTCTLQQNSKSFYSLNKT